MSKPARKPPKFQGVLNRPLDDTKAIEPQIHERWAALRERYRLSPAAPDYWQRMAASLAHDCVPGFKEKRRVGRPPTEPGVLVVFWLEVEAIKRERTPPLKTLPAVGRYIERKTKAGSPPPQKPGSLRNRHTRSEAKARDFIARMIEYGQYETFEAAVTDLIARYSTVHKKSEA